MYKRLNLYKDKLPKRKRRASDDDVYIKGMYNPFLDTTGYEVEDIRESGITTADKGVLADYPDFEGIGWIFDSEIKDYESLLKDRRNKMTQTFRYMLKQNSISSPSEPSEPSEPSSMPSGLPNNISRSNSSQSSQPQQRSQIMDDLRRLREFFSFGGGANEDEDEEEEEAQASNKNNPTPPQSSSSSSSSRRSSNPALPVYQTVTPPQSVRSSPPQSVHSSRRSSNSARPSTVLSSSTSVASTIDYGFNQ